MRLDVEVDLRKCWERGDRASDRRRDGAVCAYACDPHRCDCDAA
jgi:hypothetical protein